MSDLTAVDAALGALLERGKKMPGLEQQHRMPSHARERLAKRSTSSSVEVDR